MEHDQTATAAFLRAEDAATQLAEELTLLAKETRHYDGAAKSLEEVGASVRALADAVFATSERAALVVEAMQQVGAPELIDRVRMIETGLNESRTREEELLAGVGKTQAHAGERDARSVAAIAALAEQLTAIAERLRVVEDVAASKANVETVADTLRGLTNDLSERLQSVEARLEAVGDRIAVLQGTSATKDTLAESMSRADENHRLVQVALEVVTARVAEAELSGKKRLQAVDTRLEAAADSIAALQRTSATNEALAEFMARSDKNHGLARVALEGAATRASESDRSSQKRHESVRGENMKMDLTLRRVLIVAVAGALLSTAALAVSVRNGMTLGAHPNSTTR